MLEIFWRYYHTQPRLENSFYEFPKIYLDFPKCIWIYLGGGKSAIAGLGRLCLSFKLISTIDVD